MAMQRHPGCAQADSASDVRTRIQRLLKEALRHLDEPGFGDAAACAQYIAQALRIHRQSDGGAGPGRPGLSEWQARAAQAVGTADLARSLSITDMAAACKLSRGYFTRAFTATFGISPHRWRHGKRLELARQLLHDPTQPIADIAIACGFNDQAHLTRAFKAATGVTPHVYRQRALRTPRGVSGASPTVTRHAPTTGRPPAPAP